MARNKPAESQGTIEEVMTTTAQGSADTLAAEVLGSVNPDAAAPTTDTPAPRKRGPRKKAAAEAPAVEPEPAVTAEQMRKFVEDAKATYAPMVHSVLSSFIDRNFPADPYRLDEAETLVAAAAPVALKHSGKLAKWGEEITLVLVVGMQLIPRIQNQQRAAKLAGAIPGTVMDIS